MRRDWQVLPVVNWLLFWFAAFLCFVLVCGLIDIALQPAIRRGRHLLVSSSPAVAKFAAFSSGKKKVVLALPVVLVSLALMYVPVSRIAYGAILVVFVLSLVMLVVGMIEMRWARGIARTDAAMARLPSFVRDLIALATVFLTVGLAIVLARVIL